MSAILTRDELERASNRLIHGVMAQLHIAISRTDETYESLARKVGWSVKKVQRAFWDREFWRESHSLPSLAYLAHALDCRVTVQLLPRELSDDDIPF